MVSLEYVSTQNLFDYLTNGLESNNYLLKILKENNIENYQELKILIDKLENNKDIDLDAFKFFLSNAIDNLEKMNKLIEKPFVYQFNKYVSLGMNNFSLEKTDKETMCKRIIYMNPIRTYPSVKIMKFNDLSIYQAKDLLGKYYFTKKQKVVQNALIGSVKGLGMADIPMIKAGIDYYDKQVIRQMEESKLKDINFFDLNMQEKELIIRKNYKEIIEYIVYNATNCVWGKMTERQKKLMLQSITGKGDYKIIKENFVNIFRDYTTLSELEDGKIKSKTLNRFIIK